ncbi:Fc.00g084060.m01.CDS01 [Cosmosporella sp. VM-42]
MGPFSRLSTSSSFETVVDDDTSTLLPQRDELATLENTAEKNHNPFETATQSFGEDLKICEGEEETPISWGNGEATPVVTDGKQGSFEALVATPPSPSLSTSTTTSTEYTFVQQHDDMIPEYFHPISTGNSILGNICLDGIEDMAEGIQAVAFEVYPDTELIEKCWTQRRGLSFMQQRSLDQKLLDMNESTPGEYIRALIAKGASPNSKTKGHKVSFALGKSLDSGNIECVCALLQGGADPNAWVNQRFVALPYAIGVRNEPGTWALIAAGARADGSCRILSDSNDVELDNIYAEYQMPLRSAVEPALIRKLPRQGEWEKQVRMVRFLLANGADASSYGPGCYSATQLMNTLSNWIVRWSGVDKLATIRVARLMLESTIIDMRHSMIPTGNLTCRNVFNFVACYGNADMLKLLGSYVLPYCDSSLYWARAVSFAAAGRAWGCLNVLMKPPFARPEALLYLIADYLNPDPDAEKVSLDWFRFSRAAQMILESGTDPSEAHHVTYERQRYLCFNTRKSKEISPLQLVDKIATKKSRSQVRNLLKQYKKRKGKRVSELSEKK